jgi:hypothetical protein
MFPRCSAATLAALAIAVVLPGQAAATFDEPIPLSEAGQEANSPQLAVDTGGDGVFTWLRWDGANWRAQARARSATGALSPVQTLSSSGREAALPRVAVDADGDALFAWSRYDGANYRVQVRARTAAGALSSVQTLSASGQSSFVQDVAVDADGDAIVLWSTSGNLVQARARSAAGVLSPVQDLNVPGPIVPQPQLGVDADGDAVFAWLHWDGSTNRVQARARSAAGTLGPVQTLSAIGEQATAPELAVESDGDALFTWSAGDRIQARKRTAAGTLGSVQTVGPAGLATDVPQVAIDADGDAVFAWLRSDGANWRVQARGRTKAASLSAVRNLSAPGLDAGWPRVDVDAGGDAVVSWQRIDHGDVTVVQARPRAAAGTLSAVQTLSDGEAAAELPQVAVAPGGDTMVTWQGFVGANTRIQAAAGP